MTKRLLLPLTLLCALAFPLPAFADGGTSMPGNPMPPACTENCSSTNSSVVVVVIGGVVVIIVNGVPYLP